MVDVEQTSRERILADLARQDYAIVDLKPRQAAFSARDCEEDMLRLAARLRLGDPFTPQLYAKPSSDDYTTQGLFNHVGGPATKADHPAFSSNSELELHTDGTLNPVGEVRISMLACVTEAREGGDSIIFRAAALGKQLSAQHDIRAFFDPRALRRHTTVAEKQQFDDGPVLQNVGDSLFARYCTTPRDEWRYDAVPGLTEARITFEDAARYQKAQWTHQFLLKRGQVLIMDNARVSHGRTEFRDAPGSPRHIVRALFRQYPNH